MPSLAPEVAPIAVLEVVDPAQRRLYRSAEVRAPRRRAKQVWTQDRHRSTLLAVSGASRFTSRARLGEPP